MEGKGERLGRDKPELQRNAGPASTERERAGAGLAPRAARRRRRRQVPRASGRSGPGSAVLAVRRHGLRLGREVGTNGKRLRSVGG